MKKPSSKTKQTGNSADLLSMDEAIARLKTTRPTFYRWLKAGTIKGMKAGRQWRFYRSEVERFLRGEDRPIEVAADLTPLIASLESHLRGIGIKEMAGRGAENIRRVFLLMVQAGGASRASDLELAPYLVGDRRTVVLRCRIDGVLQTVVETDPRLLPAIVAQWKAMAACNVNEKAAVQDGRIMLEGSDTGLGRTVTLHVTFLASALGECLTARFLDQKTAERTTSLDLISFAAWDKERILKHLGAPSGLIMVAGPSPCGKTTTMYACLKKLAGPERKVVTVEDPVEILFPWLLQIPVNPAVGVTYAKAVRAVLRSAPDVVMIGELRDTESLQIAHQLALTGHLVLGGTHVNDAPGVLIRMREMGSPPVLINGSVRLIVAQRLLRTLCDCAAKEDPTPPLLRYAEEAVRTGGLDWAVLPKAFRIPKGCARCAQTGYRGREAVAETLELSAGLMQALDRGAPAEELRALAVRGGMRTMTADAVRRAAEGKTSLAEVMRVFGAG